MTTMLERRVSHRAPAAGPAPGILLPAALLAVIAGGAAGILVLWWHDTWRITNAAEWLTGIGRITGLLAGYGAPMLMVLMARIPLVERHVGADRVARWHAFGGRYVISLLAAHVLTVIWGYALTAHKNVVGEGVQIILTFPDMIKATIATLVFFATAIISMRAARRRLSYETWYYLHLATYVAIALGFAHQLTTGADLSQGPGGLLWYALYLGSFGLLGWFRLVLPWLRDRRHRLRVAEVRAEAPGVVSVFLEGERLEQLRAEPGQFFRLQFQTPGLRWTANPYSLSAPPHPRYLRFTVKGLGSHSAAVASVPVGTRVRAEGPYGAFTARRRRGRDRRVLLIGAGVGITPLRALFETMPGELTLIQRARRPEDLLFRAELTAIAEHRGARVVELVGSRREIGDLGAVLRRMIPDLSRHEVYLCGPEAFSAEVVAALRAAGVRRFRIHHESFAF